MTPSSIRRKEVHRSNCEIDKCNRWLQISVNESVEGKEMGGTGIGLAI